MKRLYSDYQVHIILQISQYLTVEIYDCETSFSQWALCFFTVGTLLQPVVNRRVTSHTDIGGNVKSLINKENYK